MASWAVLQVVDTLGGALNLPDGFDSVALAVLILGLPIVLATAFVAAGAARETRHVADLPTSPAVPGPLEDSAFVAADAPTRMWRQLAVIFAALFMLAAGVAGWAQLRPDPPQPVTRIALTPPLGVEIGGGTRGMAVSPDGWTVVFADGPTGQLYQRDVRQLDAVPIPGAGNAWYPFFSPDGEWVGYFDRGDNNTLLKKTRLDGSAAQTLTPAPGASRSAGWGLDGTIVMNSAELGGLSRVRDTGGRIERIANTEGPGLRWLDLLPDGRAVLAQTLGGQLQVVAVSLETGERSVLFPGRTPRYVPTGHIVFWREEALWAVGFDPGRLAVIGEATQIVDGVQSADNGLAHFAVGGDLLFYQESGGSQGRAPLWLGRDGSEEFLNATPTEGMGGPAVSPDGSMIAFEYDPPADADAEDIWVYDLAQGTFSRLTFGASRNMNPFWSPDGSEVGFSSDRDGFFSLYSRPLDLSREAQLLFADPDDGLYEGSWTPDGRWLVYRRGGVNTTQTWDLLYAAPHADSTPVVILDTPAVERNPSLSPDGRWLAYTSDESGETEVYVRPFPGPGGRSQVSTDGGINPVWAHNGRELFYLGQTGPSLLTLATIRTDPDFAVESRQQLFPWPYVGAGGDRHWDLSPDSQRILALGASTQAGELEVGRFVGVLNFSDELQRLVPR